MTEQEALQKAVDEAGSQKLLAEMIGTHQPKISRMLKTKCAAEFVLPIEAAVRGKVTRHDLRPDLYPIEDRTKTRTKKPH